MMKVIRFFRSIQMKIMIIYVLLILIAMQVIGVYFTGKLEERFQANFDSQLVERSNLLAYNIEIEMLKDEEEEERSLQARTNALLLELFNMDNTDVQVIDSNNTVISTSNPNLRIVGQRTTDVSVKRALLGTGDEKTQIHPTTGHRTRVLSLPVYSEDTVIGAIYVEASMEEIYEQMEQINGILLTGTIIAVGITAILGIFLARTITKPIYDMRKQAQAIGEGNFSRTVKVYDDDEIGQLAISFNTLTKKLKDANDTTEGERRKLASVLAHMTDAVIATDKKGQVILVNKSAEEMLEKNQAEVLGEDMTKILNLDKLLNLEDLYEFTAPILLDLDNEDEEIIVKANFSVIEKENGIQDGLIAVLHDVTEEERIEHERREFVANVSHELRTPLTSMKSYLEALADGAIYDKEIAPRFIDVTQNETERMIRLINDLLQLSKMDSKDVVLEVTSIDVSNFLKQILERFEMATKEQDIHFKYRIPDKGIFTFGDRDKLTQLLDNILSNAVKYSPEGGTITCSLKEEKDRMVISIRDEGVGIPKESIEHVFDRFYRVDKARARSLGGTGLGLAIAKEIVEAHGGSIWVSSDWGKGTAISFSLLYDEEAVSDL